MKLKALRGFFVLYADFLDVSEGTNQIQQPYNNKYHDYDIQYFLDFRIKWNKLVDAIKNNANNDKYD